MASRYCIIVCLLIFWIASCKEPAQRSVSNSVSKPSEITLCNSCPPGFELTKDNRCLLRNQYQQYRSLVTVGVGGLQTALPQYRDGFTPQQIDLGRYLFFDPLLSKDKTLSCASCHHPDKGFSDAKPQSIGYKGVLLSRSAPTIWNVAFLKSFFWDGRANTLEGQMEGPLFNPQEMANDPENLIKTINEVPDYKRLFADAFPQKDSTNISLSEICTAIAAFEASLVSLNSRYDQYAHGYAEALNSKEIAGFNVFRSFVARCSECHTPPLFTNQQLAVLGVPEPTGKPLDIGAEKVFHEPSLRAAFKVPTLRNIEKTAPYMHSGVFKTLKETVKFYTDGRGHAVPKGENLKIHWHIWEPKLTDEELDRLVDFLKTLTDESFKPAIPQVVPSGINIQAYLTAENGITK